MLTPELQYLAPTDLLPFMGRNLTIDVAVTGRPELAARVIVQPQYDCPQFVNLAGRSGRNGWAGRPGEDGQPGPKVRVGVGYVTGSKGEPLVLVRVDDVSGIRARTLFLPGGPPLQVVLDGGGGGAADMRGMLFGAAAAHPQGGDGGDGGAAEIAYDEAFPELERKIIVVNRGGPGGAGRAGSTNGRPGRPGAMPRVTKTSATALFSDEIAHGVPIRRAQAASTAGSSI
jgi:hypothetical protein